MCTFAHTISGQINKKSMEKINNTLVKKDKNKEKTVLQHMEIIIEGLENKSFTDDFFSEYHLPLQSIATTYDLSLSQALYFTICINLSLSNRINIRDIEKFLHGIRLKFSSQSMIFTHSSTNIYSATPTATASMIMMFLRMYCLLFSKIQPLLRNP